MALLREYATRNSEAAFETLVRGVVILAAVGAPITILRLREAIQPFSQSTSGVFTMEAVKLLGL